MSAFAVFSPKAAGPLSAKSYQNVRIIVHLGKRADRRNPRIVAMVRTARFELATTCVESRESTIELRPLSLVTTFQGRSCVAAG